MFTYGPQNKIIYKNYPVILNTVLLPGWSIADDNFFFRRILLTDSLVFQDLLHILTISSIDCITLRSIFLHWGQQRDSYSTITKSSSAQWCKRKDDTLIAWRWKLFEFEDQGNGTYFVNWETFKYLLYLMKGSTKWGKKWYLDKIRKFYTSSFCSKVYTSGT